MNCPVCEGVRMREVEKSGIMIDICPDCKGVWLDRGELDKLMSGVREFRQEYERERETYTRPDAPSYPQRYDDDDDYKKHGHHGYPKHKKKKTVFDMFDDLF